MHGLPSGRPWVMRMRWTDLLFAHWPVDPEPLRRQLPAGLELDLYDGQAWLGVVPFRMSDVSPRGVPALPGVSTFPEVNVRTYVRQGERTGVWFLSLDASSRLTVVGARAAFHLPYFYADMAIEPLGDGVAYRSERRDARGAPAALDVRYAPIGPVRYAEPGSFEAWSTHRMRLFAADDDGRLTRTEIRHAPWPLQLAEATFTVETLSAAAGIDLPATPPHLAFARKMDVRGWWPKGIEPAEV
jgi:uncharacterized protein YqjF (DUF2071 family)